MQNSILSSSLTVRHDEAPSQRPLDSRPRTVSVVVPAYNPDQALAVLVEALLSQTVRVLEVIVVDDASDAPVARILPANDRIRILRLDGRTGAGGARAAGAAISRGEVIAFTDADCLPPPDWIERLLGVLDREPGAVAVSGGYAHSRPVGLFGRLVAAEEEYGVAQLERLQSGMTGGNLAVRRSAWETARTGREEIHFRGMASGEDTVLAADLRAHGTVIYDRSLRVAHEIRGGAGYFKRHVNRGRSGMLIALFGLAGRSGNGDSFAAYGGIRLVLAHAALVGLPLAVLAALSGWVYPGLAIAVASAAIYAALSKPFFDAVKRSWDGGAPGPGEMPFVRLVLVARQVCWGWGAAIALAETAAGFVRRTWNVVASIAHFWVPGKLSKLFFFVTSQCNARCAFCFNLDNVVNWAARKPNELTLEEIRKIAKSCDRLPYVTLSGGEPFVRPDLPEIALAFHKLARTQWLTIPTNAALPAHVLRSVRDILVRCPDMFLTIQVSLDSLHEDHDQSRKIKGGFESLRETMAGLAVLRRAHANLRIQLGTVYGDFNVARIDEIAEYSRENFKFDQHLFGLIRESDKKIGHKNDDLVLDYIAFLQGHERREWAGRGQSLWARAVRALQGVTYGDLIDIKLNEKFLRPCSATRKFATLYDDGRVTPCEVLEQADCGNVRAFGCDLQALLARKEIRDMHRKDIVAKKCNCEWMCAIPVNALYDPKSYWRIAKALVKPDAALDRLRPAGRKNPAK